MNLFLPTTAEFVSGKLFMSVKVNAAFKHPVPRIRHDKRIPLRKMFDGKLMHKNIFALDNFLLMFAEVQINRQAVGEFGKFVGDLRANVCLISPVVKVAAAKMPVPIAKPLVLVAVFQPP